MPQSLFLVNFDSLIIDGFSQSQFIGEDTNPLGPEIQLTKPGNDQYQDCFRIQANDVEIFGLIINNFHGGIFIIGAQGGRISGCYIGTDYSAEVAERNIYGIFLTDNSTHVHVEPVDSFRNVISGNTYMGIEISDSSCSNILADNIIGLNRTASKTIGNGSIGHYGGIFIEDFSDSNEVYNNQISGNIYSGIFIYQASENIISNNFIGTCAEDPSKELGNDSEGIWLSEDCQANTISENVIYHNGGDGVYVNGAQSLYNTITKNSISHNGGIGINLVGGGNAGLAPPIISSVTATVISGSTDPNATVEIYTDPDDEGMLYQGSVIASSGGKFSWYGELTGNFSNVTTLATDPAGNTSPFSTPATTGISKEDSHFTSSI